MIVEDDKDLRDVLQYNLQSHGFSTRMASAGSEGLAMIRQSPIPHLAIVDLMLPDFSGIELIRQLRSGNKNANVPVLILTAKGEEIDRVVGFEVGADDYMVKPFSVRELVLRCKAILRRDNNTSEPTLKVQFGILRIDIEGHRTWVDDEEVLLTALEFRLLCHLLDRKGRAQNRETLLSEVWQMSLGVTTRTVDTHVKRLREKLGKAGSYIETIRGVGYRFCDQLATDL